MTRCRDGLIAAVQRAAVARGAGWDRTLHGRTWDRAERALLDAVIETGTELPAAVLAHYENRSVGALLVLARTGWRTLPVLDGTLLRTFRNLTPGTDAWRACGDALCAHAHPSLVLDLLRLPIELRFVVGSGGDEMLLRTELDDYRPAPAPGVAVNRRFDDAGWPPFVRHDLVFTIAPGTQVLVGGPFPVGRVRRVGDPPLFTEPPAPDAVAARRAVWLGHLLGPEHAEVLAASPAGERDVLLTWSTAGAFGGDVARERAAIVACWRALAAACVARGLIGAEAAAALEPPLHVTVDDRRADRGVPLPTIPPRDGR